tara:strand:- start:7792 stop:8208 length:417 start_codon:yes stop_codon:yes gene_type:complete
MSECTTLNVDHNVLHLLQEIIKDIQELKKHLIPDSIITDKCHIVHSECPTHRVGKKNNVTKKRRVRRVNTPPVSEDNIIKLTTIDKTQDSKNGVSYEELCSIVSNEITKIESGGNNEPSSPVKHIVKIEDGGEIDDEE